MLWWSVLLPPISAFNFGRGLLEFGDSWVWSYWDEYHTVGVGAIYCMIDMFSEGGSLFPRMWTDCVEFWVIVTVGIRVRCDTLSHCDFFLPKVWFLLIIIVYSYSVCGERLQASKVLQPHSNHPRTIHLGPHNESGEGLDWNRLKFGMIATLG